jgi:serine protease Do
VHTVRVIKTYRSRGTDPREEILRRFFGLPVPPSPGSEPEVEEQRHPLGVGSGVVISSDGYILTNNHVIMAPGARPADDVLVQLNDGRELRAEVIGRDPQSDLAVLKVAAEDLPFIPFADSRNLEVGDIAFAIGNPMGVGLTITQGIISATGRSNLSILGESGYENFIQTDAPINPGNSGGALVDAYGRLIGINTAILSRSGGSIGIGFAIPSGFARSVALGIIREGEVRRGLLGINMESLNADYAEAFGLPGERGVLVQSVIPGLPAERAGLEKGDIIVALGEEPVEDAIDLRLKVASHPPGASVTLRLFRDGETREVRVVLGDSRDPYG